MKKFTNVLAVLLALVMCLGIVVACAAEDEKGSDDATTTTVANTTKAPTTTKAPDTTTAEETTTEAPIVYNFEPKVAVPADGMITNADQLHAVLVLGAADQNYTVNATTIDMAGLGWVGIKGYTGIFDFGNCTIKNASFPMFTSVLGGTVKNLTLADSKQVYTDDDAQEDKDLIPLTDAGATHCRVYGGVIRYMNEGTISNVTIESTVDISADIWLNDSYVGGIVAYAKGTNVRVENCTFKGNLTTDSAKIFVGGVAGCIESGDASSHNAEAPDQSSCIAINCTNYGTVTDLGYNEDAKVGGVVGALGSGAAYKCANYGTVSSNNKGQTAGVIGHTLNELTYMYCLNAGTVKGGNAYVGGVCGYSNGTVRNFVGCVNVGSVACNEGLSTDRVGGIIGWLRKNEVVTNCYNLTTGTANFIYCKAPLDPADPTTHVSEGTPVITGCANLDTVDAVLAAVEATHPGVFVKDGTSLKLAQ